MRASGECVRVILESGLLAVLDADAPRIAIAGADGRGCLYGVGHVLRKLAIKGDICATDELRHVSITPR